MKKLGVKKSRINGSGLFATEKIKKGEVVGYIHGPTVSFRTFTPTISKMMLNWIGSGRYSWIDTTNSPFRYINHSCEPNVAIVTKRKVVALTDIPADTEITMDYSLSESEPGWSILCTCNTEHCRKHIGPIQSIPQSTYKRFKQHISKPFQKIYEHDVIHRRTAKQ